VSEETGDEVVLIKDRSGRMIGFEKLNFSVAESDFVRVAFPIVESSTSAMLIAFLDLVGRIRGDEERSLRAKRREHVEP